MCVACADKQGVPRDRLTGSIQNDILKEYVARGTWIWPVRPSMRLIADTILYANQTSPRFNPISIAGAHVRSEEHTSELQSLMRISYAVFCLKKKKTRRTEPHQNKTKYRRTHTEY